MTVSLYEDRQKQKALLAVTSNALKDGQKEQFIQAKHFNFPMNL